MKYSLRAFVTSLVIVYGTAFLHGLMLVSYPASATFLKSMRGLSDQQYGLVFLPQLVLAVLGAAAGGWLARRLGLRPLLALALLGTGFSQFALAAAGRMPGNLVFPLAAVSAGFTGLAFGLGAAPLNALPALLLPERAQAALVALHTGIGAGLALGPLLVARALEAEHWTWFCLAVALAAGVLLVSTLLVRLPEPARNLATAGAARADSPLRAPAFWGFAAVAVLYSFAEGIFANWSVIYLHEERGVSGMTASLALSAFWAAIAVGRLVSSALLLRVRPAVLWRALPLLMMAACLLLPTARGAVTGIALFTLAGLGCSAFFPLTIGLASDRFAASAALVSSALIAALMIGNGLGSFVLGPLREGRSLAALYAAAAVFPAGALLVGWRLARPVQAPAAA